MNCILINPDLGKAFDRVSHQSIFNVLHAFRFWKDFLEWVQFRYIAWLSQAVYNDFKSKGIPVLRVVQYGYSLSHFYISSVWGY